MRSGRTVAIVAALTLLLAANSALAGPQQRLTSDNPNPPTSPVKLIFVHHSTGGNWLADPNQDQPYGGLGRALMDNNYFVSATNYGWGPYGIGDRTDIPNWPEWFTGPNSGEILSALYVEDDQNFGDFGSWPRLPSDPGGENEIILFKSCFPNSDLWGNPDDPPYAEPNDWEYSVSNAKAVYNNILTYFQTRQDKLFVVVTAPPLMESATTSGRAANARVFNNWLRNDWLAGYPYSNVAVFDYYNVLTSNGSAARVDDPATNEEPNDAGWTDGNHHRWWDDAAQHLQTISNNYSAYPSDDSHPSTAGHQKATAEFVQLLNVFYHRWKGSVGTPTPTPTGAPPTATPTATHTSPPSTPTATPTATATTPPGGQQTMIFQDGVSPNASYAGTTDATITTWSGNSYANLGGLDYLQVGETGDADEFRLLVRFDLVRNSVSPSRSFASAGGWLPADVHVDEAWLELRAYDAGYDDDPQDGAAHRVIEEWVEGDGWDLEADGRSEGVTWATARPGVSWATPGGDFDLVELDRVAVAADPDGWYRWDVTAAVRAWIDETAPNDGLLLEPDNAPWAHHEFHSSEYGTANLRPRLVVHYTVGGAATPTPSVTPDLPDLVVNSMKIELETGDSCDYVSTELGVRVWVENIGGGDASPFVVDVNGSQQDITSGLSAGQITSTWLADSYVWPGDNTAFADATFLVEESDEDNNQLTQLLPIPTLPPTCTPPAHHLVYLPLILKDWAPPQPTPTPTATTVIPSGLIQPSDLVYQGAFAYPSSDDWAYSGHALAYYPEGDPTGPADGHPGSLYAAGHANHDLVGEMTIPEPVVSGNFDDLLKASVLRSLTDITGGWKDDCIYAAGCIYREVDGLEYLSSAAYGGNRIVWNLRDWYNTSGYDQDSLGWSNLDMTGAQGVWHIGQRPSDSNVFHNAKTCNYLFKAPESFASENLDGKWLIAGNHREAGALGGSQGPTLYALAPWRDGSPPASGQTLDALALLYYPEIYECVWEAEGDINEHPDPGVCHFPDYRAADNWGGGAWVQTATRTAVLIFGRKGLGDNCYGSAAVCGEDACALSSGYHAYPYEPQMLFYDPEELKEVLAGTREPWQVLPYAVYTVEEVLDQECAVLGAAAYDEERRLIYVTEQEAGPWGETVVHVWRVA